ncbi:4376_t:CDS:2, partial [Funneliformis geosporum]
FSMIMWEFISGVSPFDNEAHDLQLSLDICNGINESIGKEKIIEEIVENQTTNHVSIERNPFSCIQLKEPTINIRSYNGSNVCNNSNFIYDSEFISIKATISPGISATSYNEINKLQLLLISHKNEINEILKSQHVYAIGIDFQNNSIRPCISCWVVKPLDTSILKCLEDLLDNKYEAIYQILIPDKSDINHIIKESGDIVAVVNADDPNLNQSFNIDVRLHAKYSHPFLEYEINVDQCKTGTMLSENMNYFQRRRGRGYFFDSFKVCVSPISCKPPNYENILFRSSDIYPLQLNREIDILKGYESQNGVELGKEPKLTFGVKNATNTKHTSKEWEFNYSYGHVTGDSWLHRYADDKLDKDGSRRKFYVPGRHSAKWKHMKDMSGFCITITQVVRYNINLSKYLKPDYIECPVIAHNLEITFKNFEDFNAKFAKLARSEGNYDIGKCIKLNNTDTRKLNAETEINRTFKPPSK